MGTHNDSVKAPNGPKHGSASDQAAIVTKSPVGTPPVVDLYNDQLPPGGR